MKYYKYELWLKSNTGNEQEIQKADEEWEKNDQAYSEIFQQIKERLPKKFLKVFINNNGFHDFTLIGINTSKNHKSKKSLIEANLIISDGQKKLVLKYSGVSKMIINYGIEDISFGSSNEFENDGYDEWGYSEFLSVDDRTLSHEILFTSGATFNVHFRNIIISSVKEDIVCD